MDSINPAERSDGLATIDNRTVTAVAHQFIERTVGPVVFSVVLTPSRVRYGIFTTVDSNQEGR